MKRGTCFIRPKGECESHLSFLTRFSKCTARASSISFAKSRARCSLAWFKHKLYFISRNEIFIGRGSVPNRRIRDFLLWCIAAALVPVDSNVAEGVPSVWVPRCSFVAAFKHFVLFFAERNKPWVSPIILARRWCRQEKWVVVTLNRRTSCNTTLLVVECFLVDLTRRKQKASGRLDDGERGMFQQKSRIWHSGLHGRGKRKNAELTATSLRRLQEYQPNTIYT